MILETQNLINKVLSYKTWTDKRRIDKLLEYDCNMYTCLGKDSTKKEVGETKKNSKLIYKAISKINPEEGKDYLWHMDK